MFSPNAAQTRVLDIPELLDMIFGFLDESSNASNASVCKRWSDIALDSLWRDLDDLYRLFRILKPLKQAEEYPDSPYVRFCKLVSNCHSYISGLHEPT